MKRFAISCVIVTALLVCGGSVPTVYDRSPVCMDPVIDQMHRGIPRPTDSTAVRQRKETTNTLFSQLSSLLESHQASVAHNALTTPQYLAYRRHLRSLNEQLVAIGPHPEDDTPEDVAFQRDIDGYISDQGLIMCMHEGQNGKVLPAYRPAYNAAVNRAHYLQQIKADYYAGKLTAEEASRAFTDQYEFFPAK